MNKYLNHLLFFLFVFFISIIILGCGEKKTETNETLKKDTISKTQTNTGMNTTTQKDTTKTKTDATTSGYDVGKESNTVIMETSLGNMTIELYPKDAPKHVANFKKLVKEHFYDGILFHRVIPGFMIQGGDPLTRSEAKSLWGQGGPGYTLQAEIKLKHEMGSLAAARLGDQVNPTKESSGSQFYIVTGDASHLDGQYTVYGKVISGMDVAHAIEKVKRDAVDDPIEKVVIKKVYFAQ
jgi:cyclophilin family peptidyl-prolyl cis-trans isomerase